ncbi:hypothetical protein RFI_12308, partial [Reticulomyxa filosa]
MGNIPPSDGINDQDWYQLFAVELPFTVNGNDQLTKREEKETAEGKHKQSLTSKIKIKKKKKKKRGQGKVLKSFRCTVDTAALLVKAYIKPTLDGGDMNAAKLEDAIEKEKKKYKHIQSLWSTASQPGLVPLIPIENKNKIQENRCYFLGRQYFAHNLYDRFHTPPYLEPIEKKWIIYQLLQAVSQAHNTKIVHGDIKTENIMLTTWNWVFLTGKQTQIYIHIYIYIYTYICICIYVFICAYAIYLHFFFFFCRIDFHPYKPDSLPYSNPFQWGYFFEDAKRARCYIAPERFYVTQAERSLLPSSDIFSVGCVIAEVFMDGLVLFDHERLLAYKDSKYDPSAVIAKKISDPDVQKL